MVSNINSAAAAGAYAKMGGVAGAQQQQDIAGPASFGDMLKNVTATSIDIMKAGEVASARAVTGEATLPEVVQAVNAAEMTLQTVVAVRDKLVSAYQEMMRMPI